MATKAARVAILGPDKRLIAVCTSVDAAWFLTVKGSEEIRAHNGKLVAIRMPSANLPNVETLSAIRPSDFSKTTKRSPEQGGLVNKR